MKIVVAEHYGICFGVRDAIAQAEALAQEAPLTILGELAHNPVVRQRLRSAGAEEGSLDRFETVRSARVLITAHGASDKRRNAWVSAGFDVRDGTCPLVRHAHTQLRLLVQAGYHPVVIGLKTHVEFAVSPKISPAARSLTLPLISNRFRSARVTVSFRKPRSRSIMFDGWWRKSDGTARLRPR